MSDRILTGLIALAVVLVIGTLAYRSQISEPPVQVTSTPAATETKTKRSTQLRARIEKCRREDNGKTFADGYIENIGNADLHFVTVEVRWIDRLGNIVEANELYVLRDETLAPGARKQFISTTENTVAVTCKVRKVDWW